MSRLTSSWTGPSWIASAIRRRMSASASIARRDSSRARTLPVDSALRSWPMKKPADSTDAANSTS